MASPGATGSNTTIDRSEERPSKILRTTASGPSQLAKIITVTVGTGENCEVFILHEYLLRGSSVFFDNALKHDWKEAKERTVALPESCPTAFAAYAKFLLTALLFIKAEEQNPSDSNSINSNDGSRDITSCMGLLRLANFPQAPSFQDAIVDAFVEVIAMAYITRSGSHPVLAVNTINNIYRHSTENSTLRRLVVDISLHGWSAHSYTKHVSTSLNAEFLVDFMQAASPCILSSQRNKDIPNPININESCRYHNHTLRGEPCYRIKHLYFPESTTPAAATVKARESTEPPIKD